MEDNTAAAAAGITRNLKEKTREEKKPSGRHSTYVVNIHLRPIRGRPMKNELRANSHIPGLMALSSSSSSCYCASAVPVSTLSRSECFALIIRYDTIRYDVVDIMFLCVFSCTVCLSVSIHGSRSSSSSRVAILLPNLASCH